MLPLLTFRSIGPSLGTYFVRLCTDGTSSSENLDFSYDRYKGAINDTDENWQAFYIMLYVCGYFI